MICPCCKRNCDKYCLVDVSIEGTKYFCSDDCLRRYWCCDDCWEEGHPEAFA